MHHRPPAAPAAHLVGRVWLPFACAYFLSFGLRNVNAVLAPQLAGELALDAAQLGLLTSAYFAAFALAQLPAGVALDRYGPRRVNAALMLAGAAGCVLQLAGTSFAQVAAGRALLGLGMAVGLMSAVKALSQWFALARLPLGTSLLLTFGSLGGIVAAGPVGWALEFVSWRAVLGVGAALLVAAACFLYLVAPDRGEAAAGDSWLELAAGFGAIFSSAAFWRVGAMLAVSGGAYSAVQSLWIGTWLRDVGGLAPDAVVRALTVFALAATAGYVVTGTLIDRLMRWGVAPFTLYKLHCGAVIAVFALIVFGDARLAVPLWLVYFGLGMGGPLVFTILARAFPARLAGRVNTAVNVLMFGSAFALQWGIGALLDQWPVENGRYAAAGYAAAFGGLLAAMCALYALLLRTKP